VSAWGNILRGKTGSRAVVRNVNLWGKRKEVLDKKKKKKKSQKIGDEGPVSFHWEIG